MVMVRAEGEKSGCIKKSQGPWLVHKTTKNGCVVTKYRYPSEKERQNNKQRERKRRSITKKIFAGLRAHGNYQLPKHADSNDLLKALCEEAGLHVDEDGNVHKKHRIFNTPSIINSNFGAGNNKHGEDKYCKCSGDFQAKDTGLSMGFSLAEQDINLALSLS